MMLRYSAAEHTGKAGVYARTIIDLVDKILRLKAQNDTKAQTDTPSHSDGATAPEESTAPLERKIDAATTRPCYGRMYKLYGLTEEKIKVVERR